MTGENKEIRSAIAEIAALLADVADTTTDLLSLSEYRYNRAALPELRAKGRSIHHQSQRVRKLTDRFRTPEDQ